MKFRIFTLGCKVNSCDSDIISSVLKLYGHSESANDDEKVDFAVINTCAVTAESERKSRQLIRKIKTQYKGAYVFACGCWSRVGNSPEESVPEADLIIKHKQPEVIAREILKFLNPDIDMDFLDNLTCMGGTLSETKVRSALKIQDGCNRYCTYCIIPYARNKMSSVPMEKAVEEVKSLVIRGYKEVALTGIHIASYKDGENTLIDLIEKISSETSIERIRLGSLEPKLITEEFVTRLKKVKNFCPHFHLSLQSGSSTVLRRMHRRYSAEEYLSYCRLIKEHIPNAAFTTDIIVGFPGESEEEFNQTLDFVEKVGFSHVHIFPYSQRQGTPAADYPDQLSKSVKHERVKILSKKCDEVSNRVLSEFIGKTMNVLCEYINDDGLAEGYSENYIRTCFASDENAVNQICPVIITKVCGNMLFGEVKE